MWIRERLETFSVGQVGSSTRNAGTKSFLVEKKFIGREKNCFDRKQSSEADKKYFDRKRSFEAEKKLIENEARKAEKKIDRKRSTEAVKKIF